jgi:hypothetical protein
MQDIRKSLYIESTIPSYLKKEDSKNPINYSRQLVTRAFWKTQRHKFRLVTSQAVLDECGEENQKYANERLEYLEGIELLEITEDVKALAALYQPLLDIPDSAKLDCTHLAICVVHKVDYLLSWNFAHLGQVSEKRMRKYNLKHDLWVPELLTPEYIITIIKEEI